MVQEVPWECSIYPPSTNVRAVYKSEIKSESRQMTFWRAAFGGIYPTHFLFILSSIPRITRDHSTIFQSISSCLTLTLHSYLSTGKTETLKTPHVDFCWSQTKSQKQDSENNKGHKTVLGRANGYNCAHKFFFTLKAEDKVPSENDSLSYLCHVGKTFPDKIIEFWTFSPSWLGCLGSRQPVLQYP